MILTNRHADQIASLINKQNQLTTKYTRQHILDHKDNYICRFSVENIVIACVEIKRVQWYQSEILHLTVDATETRKGHGKSLLQDAEQIARTKGARILQCTIREGNVESSMLFAKCGFVQVGKFYNSNSGNNVAVLQKIL